MSEWDPEPALRALEDWAERVGVQVRTGKPAGAAEVVELARRYPRAGSIAYAPPPSYLAFLAKHGSLELLVPMRSAASDGVPAPPPARGAGSPLRSGATHVIDGELRRWTGFGVYAPRDAARVTREVVFVEESRELTTNHLVAFAPHELSPALTTCFVTDLPDGRGELPVVVHDRDEPMYARYVDGSPLDRAAWDELPWKSFGEWLDARVSAAVRLSRDDLEI
jgi:hypothetical protein